MHRLALAAVCCLVLLPIAMLAAHEPPQPSQPPYPFPHEPAPPPVQAPYSPWEHADSHDAEGTLPTVPAPVPPASPRPPSVPRVLPPRAPAPPLPRLHHLRQAAQHLEAAGCKDHAARIRDLAKKEEQQFQLVRKLQQLKALHDEIELLRSAMGERPPLVSLDVELMDGPPGTLHRLEEKLAELGFTKLPARREYAADFEPGLMTVIRDKQERESLNKVLSQEKELAVFSRPRLATINYQPAMVQSNGDVPVTWQDSEGRAVKDCKRFGLRVEFVPEVSSEGLIRLDVRPALIARGDSTRRAVSDDVSAPLRVDEADAGLEVRSGETLVICWPVSPTAAKPVLVGGGPLVDEYIGRDIVVFVTPRLDETGDLAP